MKKLFLLVLIFFSFFIYVIGTDFVEEKIIYIGATSDEHGHLFDYDFISRKNFPGGLIRVSTWIKEFRKNHKNLIITYY